MEKPSASPLAAELKRDNIVRVTIPAQFAYDLGAMQKITASVLDRLGCSACHSGHDIRFDIERRFIVDEKLNVIGRSTLLER